MEHHPYMTLNDETELTYSDIHKKDGKEYVNIHFETPDGDVFNHLDIIYPSEEITSLSGYTIDEVEALFKHYRTVAPLIFRFAKNEQ